ncbi:hypothetical protein RQP46_011259 [Phenoliferia psychrophenolica]
MATIHSLPSELLLEVLELAASNEKHLAFLALVCRQWTAPAQRLLFQSVRIDDAREARAWLACPARTTHTTTTLTLGDGLDEQTGSDVLDSCPDLLRLNLEIPYLKGGGYHRLTRVHLKGLKALLLMYPEDFPVVADRPIPQSVVHLSVWADNNLSTSQIQNILLPSQDSLKVLELHLARHLPTLAGFATFFSSVPFSHVRSLVLGRSYAYREWPALTKSLPSLTSLEIRVHQNTEGVTVVGACATPTLETLSFTESYLWEDDIDELGRIIKLSNLEGLRRLNLLDTPKEAFDGPAVGGLALLEECEKRGIVVYCKCGYL